MAIPYTDYINKNIDIGFTIRQGPGLGKNNGYAHRHSFYEFLLVIDGLIQLYTTEGDVIIADNNTMILMCPGYIHTTYAEGINIQLGIMENTMAEVMHFLFGDTEIKFKPIDSFKLSPSQVKYFSTQIRYASLFSPTDAIREKAFLKKFFVTLITDMVFPAILAPKRKTFIPDWLTKLTESYQSLESITEGLDYMKRNTGFSAEYICRSFKKYLDMTPGQFITMQKLNYAANMLVHSDQEISQISEDIGFSSLSHFYKKFREAFQLSPAQYRKEKKLL